MFSTLALKQATVSMLMEYSNSQSSMARHSACSWIPSQSFPAPSSLYTKSCLLLLLGFCLWKSITNEYRAYTKAEAFAPQLSVLNALWCLWICVVCTDQVFAWNFFFCLHDWHKPFANIMFKKTCCIYLWFWLSYIVHGDFENIWKQWKNIHAGGGYVGRFWIKHNHQSRLVGTQSPKRNLFLISVDLSSLLS